MAQAGLRPAPTRSHDQQSPAPCAVPSGGVLYPQGLQGDRRRQHAGAGDGRQPVAVLDPAVQGDSVYLGDSTVSVANGFPVAPAQAMTDEESSDAMWAVSPTSSEIRIILTQA